MNLRAPIAKVRGLGSAHSGTGHWMHQKFTAMALLPLIIWFVYHVASLAGAPHAEVVAWMQEGWTIVLFSLFIIALFSHINYGVQSVIEDYVHNHTTALFALYGLKYGSWLLGAVSLMAIWRVGLGV